MLGSFRPGACADELSFFTLSESQRLTLARHCRLSLLGQQVEGGNCNADVAGCQGERHAPQFYDGSCPRVLDTRAMSVEAKELLSTKCGVRCMSGQ